MGRRRWLALFPGIALLSACSASDDDSTIPPLDGRDYGEVGDVGCRADDADGDTISDADEGRGDRLDTDADTLPDDQDTDSDDDTIPDAVEAGDSDPCTPPRDTDVDGTPDARDIDADGNGVFDRFEGSGDLDGDTLLDALDPDDDGDMISDLEEIAGNPSAPPDHDGDTRPDYRDTDSDDDTIGDRDERGRDTDADTVPDRFDEDSDNDTIPDSDEAGDADLATYPVDTDGDGTPDVWDADSDADGLSDRLEHESGTDPTRGDSDGDGVNDLIEVAAGTGALDPADNPRARGNFVFEVPYEEDPNPWQDTLVFATNLQKADVYFAVDTSGSMDGEIANLRSGLRSIILPGIVARIPDVRMGAGRFEDCPGAGCSNAMNNLQDITTDIGAVESAIASMTGLCGGTEPYLDMLWLLATGDTSAYASSDVRPRPRRCADPATVGWPCFRPEAVKIIVQCGDEVATQTCGGRSVATVTAAMNAQRIKFIGVNSGASRPGFEQVANGTSSVDATTGRPLVFDISASGTGLSDAVVDAVDQLAHNVPIRVDAIPADGADEPPHDPPVDAVVEFIAYLETNTSGATIVDPVTGETRTCTAGVETADGDGDTHPDYFPRVFPGTSVCWDIHVQRNVTVEPLPHVPQLFRATINVQGDLYTPLDSREIFFLVKPFIPPPDVPG
ncbi:MAG: hypothetical protein GYA57_21240 [Myxococcales bacterium]|nr:hypothetical protein [Myxococcales bacterium]